MKMFTESSVLFVINNENNPPRTKWSHELWSPSSMEYYMVIKNLFGEMKITQRDVFHYDFKQKKLHGI